MTKTTVHFNLDAPYHIITGSYAVVYPTDHPSQHVSNESFAYTSTVLSANVCSDGEITFETENTIYKGVHPDKQED